MVEISEVKKVEKIERVAESKDIVFGKSANSMRDWISKMIRKFQREHNLEYELVFKGILEMYNKFHSEQKDKNYELELEILTGWQGKGVTEIYKGFDNDFKVREPRKDKKTGEITWTTHSVSKENLNNMIKVIKKLEIGKTYKCYQIAKLMGMDWKNDVWRNRSKIYFQMYYHPVKILEKLNVIEYSGRGDIKRLI